MYLGYPNPKAFTDTTNTGYMSNQESRIKNQIGTKNLITSLSLFILLSEFGLISDGWLGYIIYISFVRLNQCTWVLKVSVLETCHTRYCSTSGSGLLRPVIIIDIALSLSHNIQESNHKEPGIPKIQESNLYELGIESVRIMNRIHNQGNASPQQILIKNMDCILKSIFWKQILLIFSFFFYICRKVKWPTKSCNELLAENKNQKIFNVITWAFSAKNTIWFAFRVQAPKLQSIADIIMR